MCAAQEEGTGWFASLAAAQQWVSRTLVDIEDLVVGAGSSSSGSSQGEGKDGREAQLEQEDEDDGSFPLKGHVPMYCPKNVRNLRVGQYKLWCTCGLSKTMPWCDGVGHQGTAFLPYVWEVQGTAKDGEQQSMYHICSCTRTSCPPFCDATHTYLPLQHIKEMNECVADHTRVKKLCPRCGWVPPKSE